MDVALVTMVRKEFELTLKSEKEEPLLKKPKNCPELVVILTVPTTLFCIIMLLMVLTTAARLYKKLVHPVRLDRVMLVKVFALITSAEDEPALLNKPRKPPLVLAELTMSEILLLLIVIVPLTPPVLYAA